MIRKAVKSHIHALSASVSIGLMSVALYLSSPIIATVASALLIITTYHSVSPNGE